MVMDAVSVPDDCDPHIVFRALQNHALATFSTCAHVWTRSLMPHVGGCSLAEEAIVVLQANDVLCARGWFANRGLEFHGPITVTRANQRLARSWFEAAISRLRLLGKGRVPAAKLARWLDDVDVASNVARNALDLFESETDCLCFGWVGDAEEQVHGFVVFQYKEGRVTVESLCSVGGRVGVASTCSNGRVAPRSE